MREMRVREKTARADRMREKAEGPELFKAKMTEASESVQNS